MVSGDASAMRLLAFRPSGGNSISIVHLSGFSRVAAPIAAAAADASPTTR
jgi:hypothetical protein